MTTSVSEIFEKAARTDGIEGTKGFSLAEIWTGVAEKFRAEGSFELIPFGRGGFFVTANNDKDSIRVRDNEDGTFNVRTAGQKPLTRTPEQTVADLGKFYDKFALRPR